LCLVFLDPVRYTPESSGQNELCPVDGARIAVASLSASGDAEISAIAARAPYYLIYQSSELLEVLPNEHANTEGSAGPRAAYWLSDLEVDCLVAGDVGSRMRAVLASEGIAFATAEGEAATVVSRIRGLDGNEGI
jgi:predicted Fe-Mo cluster-binding NifX family protein